VTIAAVVLAAGGSQRFADGPKLRADLRGKPLVLWAVEAALDVMLDETVVITGAVDLTDELRGLPVTYLWNPSWAEGIATSLLAGVSYARGAGHDAVVVGLGDQPFVPADAWRAVAASPSPIAVATYGGRRGNPVRLSQEVWPLLPETGDEGARRLMRGRPDLVAEVPCPGDPFDVDTVEDLTRWS
jgi:CTP:molybdopterin cytidylyltransferase MocA